MAVDRTILHLVGEKKSGGGGGEGWGWEADTDPLPFKIMACALLSLNYAPAHGRVFRCLNVFDGV